MLYLIDRLAGWWFDRRNEQIVAAHPEWDEFGLEKFECTAEGWEIALTTAGAASLADTLSKFLQVSNADNYVQLDVLPRPDRGLRPVRVTVQWARGMSPAQKAAQLEERVEELEQDRTRLEGAFDDYREALIQAANDLGHLMRVLVRGDLAKARKDCKEALHDAKEVCDDDKYLPFILRPAVSVDHPAGTGH